MNPQGTIVTSFKEPTALDLEHDFLWRAHPHGPAKGTITIFNRSHYKDVLVVRGSIIWHRKTSGQKGSNRLTILKSCSIGRTARTSSSLFLHISKEEQLERFKQRLDDLERNWKISESDYQERELWSRYVQADEDVFAKTGTKHAPWYVIPSNHK